MKSLHQPRSLHQIKSPNLALPVGIELVRLGRAEWRVSATAEPDRPLGYIERQHSGRFEVMWMTDPIRWGYAISFDAALAAFSDSAPFVGDVFDQRATVEGRENSRSGARRTTWIKASRHPNVA